MTLFNSFNKPSWQHDDPEVRKTAVKDLEDEDALVKLVHNDPDDDIRSLALTRISNGETLEELVATLTPPLLDQARKQLLQLLLPDSQDLSTLTSEDELVRIAGLTDSQELMLSCIDRVQKPGTRMDLAVNHPLAKVRLAAARGIEDEPRLKELLTLSKHKDKSVYRLCKERLDQMHQAARTEADLADQVRKLEEAASTLSSSVDSPEYKARFQVLEHHWTKLREHATAEQIQRITENLETCSSRVEKADQAAEADRERHARTEEATQTFLDILAELSAIDPNAAELATVESSEAFTKALDGFEDRWLAALHSAQPSSSQTDECKQLLNTWRKVAQLSRRSANRQAAVEQLSEDFRGLAKSDYMAHHKLLQKVEKQHKKLAWPESHEALKPRPVSQLEDLQRKLNTRLAELKKRETSKLEQVEAAFSALRKELDDSHFNNADRHHNKIRNLLKQLGPDHQDHFHQELRPLTSRLHEIHDWQGFAIEPKKIELCERMAALIGSEESPEALAGKIKALQEEWKHLGHISPRRDQALWKKFHAAAEEAYRPCKEAFAQQSRVRKENLKERMALVAQLVDYDERMNWPGSPDSEPGGNEPDWRMVQKTLDTARAAFNGIKPVDGRGERKSRKALQTVCDRIYSHVRDEYQRNISLKENLVNEARSLAEIENLRDAINRAKDIQQEWKQVGITPRKVDRKLWKQLRQACDAVFNRLDERRKAESAARNERAEQARLRARKQLERWPRLLRKMEACAQKPTNEEKAAETWGEEGSLPGGIDRDALQAWWDQGPDENVPEADLRQACIAMEILLEVDSPAEDKEARMEYQMQRLLKGLGSAQGDFHERLNGQINAFIVMRPSAGWLDRFVCEGKIIPEKYRKPV